nr:2-hydroxyacid dehydrogenase [Oryzicola mucosus]
MVVAAIPPELERRLTADFHLRKIRPEETETLPHRVVLTTSMAGIDADLMERLPNLELIACNGTGLERIDVDAATARGISVCNTPNAVVDDTADFAIGLIYATVRRLVEGDRFVRSGRWRTERMTTSRRVSSRRLGIVGLGKIGKVVAARAAALGMEVSYTARSAKPELPYRFVGDVVDLARVVDVLILCCPGGAETANLVDAQVLAALGPEGILINISRGSVVDEPALIAALEARTIAGAGLDVFAQEPEIDERFFALPNVVLEPHYAAVTLETRYDMADTLHAAIAAHLHSSLS